MRPVHVRWKLRNKILILFITVAFIPFSIINLYLYSNAQSTVKKNAEQRLLIATSQGADTVNNLINLKLLGLLSHAQGAALLSGNRDLIKDDLLNFLLQDPDLISLTFALSDGQEFVKVDKNKLYPEQALSNIKHTNEFKLASTKYNKEYISPISFDNRNAAELTISMPIFYPTYASSLSELSSVQHIPRTPDEIFGILVARISLETLQNNITSINLGETGHTYLIDNKGIIIAHQDKNLIGTKALQNVNSELERFIDHSTGLRVTVSPAPIIGQNIYGIPILSAQQPIERVNLSVITEQALDEVLSDLDQIQRQALLLFLGSLSVVIILSFIFARSLTKPVENLAEASIHIGKGEFDYPFNINTGDEFENLALAYKQMAQTLKKDQQSIIVEKNTLSTVLNNTTDGVIGLDQNFKIVLVNKAFKQIMALKNADIIGKEFNAIISVQEGDEHIPIHDYCNQVVDKDIHQVILSTSPQNTKPVILTAVKVPASITAPIKYILTIYDQSKESELEAMKVDFVSMAAHELRTPLTIIRSYLTAFISENQQQFNQDQNKMLSRIVLASEHLVSLVENLLSATRMENMNVNLVLKPIDWLPLVNKTIEDLANQASEKNIEIRIVPPHQPLTIMADEQRIREVLDNLLTNAIKYSNPGSLVEIRFKQNHQMIETYIADQGPGIPKEALHNLFTKFYRVPGVLEQTARGTGLGLYISKKIIEMHQGKIWVNSKINEGSVFAFSVPTAIDNKQNHDIVN